MKTFRVELEYITHTPERVEVASDGEGLSEPYETDDITVINLGYNVFIENEEGYTEDVEFYPIKTDTQTHKDDSLEVLEQIKADFPPEKYQNHNW